MDSPRDATAPDGSGHGGTWGPARVLDAFPVADRVRSVSIADGRRRTVSPGSHLRVRIGSEGSASYRCYSIVSSTQGGEVLRVAVRLNEGPGARGGSRFMHALDVGSELFIAEPEQHFPLGLLADRYVLVAGGIGITAVLGMAELLQQMGKDYRLHYTGRSRASMPFIAELQDRHGPKVEIVPTDEGRRLDIDALVTGVATSECASTTEMYCCGPLTLMDAARQAWTASRLPISNLRFETFANSGQLAAEQFQVRIPALQTTVDVPADRTLLQALINSGIDVMSDCQRGECGLCVVRVTKVSGRMDHRDVFLSDTQKAQSRLLCACVSRVAPHGGQRATITIDPP